MADEINADRLLSTDDAMEWAEEFVSAFRGQVVGDTVDAGLMVAWFAGAIETAKMLDRKRRRKPRPQPRLPTHDP